MSIAEKALWLIETRRGAPARLDEIAAECGVSRFHLTRAFGEVFGLPLIAYHRARRLTGAARALAFTSDDVTAIAFDAGYEAPEAFSRAFRSEFGMTPSAFRREGALASLALTDPPVLETTMIKDLPPPRIEIREAMRVAGLAREFTFDEIAAVPALWAEFVPHYGAVDGQVGDRTYGLCFNTGEGRFRYAAGVETSAAEAPPGLELLRVPAGRYAVWTHEGHVSRLRETFAAIFDNGLRRAGLTYAPGCDLEVYDDRFDARSGSGIVEIWIPIT